MRVSACVCTGHAYIRTVCVYVCMCMVICIACFSCLHMLLLESVWHHHWCHGQFPVLRHWLQSWEGVSEKVCRRSIFCSRNQECTFHDTVPHSHSRPCPCLLGNVVCRSVCGGLTSTLCWSHRKWPSEQVCLTYAIRMCICTRLQVLQFRDMVLYYFHEKIQ